MLYKKKRSAIMAHMAKRRKNVSDQLRAIIASCGVSRYRISKDTGIAQTTLSLFMTGKRGLTMKAFDRLGEYLDLEVTMKGKKRS